MSEIIKPKERPNEAFHSSCPSCGAQLLYSAEQKKLGCGHCGYEEAVDNSTDKLVEQELAAAVDQAKDFVPEDLGKKVLACKNCGASFMVDATQVNASCGFCGSLKVNEEAFKHQYIQPHGIIPFYVSRTEAIAAFQKWIKQGFFHPFKLRRLDALESLHGIYIPFWTYDAHTESKWSGQAGHLSMRNAGARPSRSFSPRVNTPSFEEGTGSFGGQMNNIQNSSVNWKSASGVLKHFFDDVLVVASDSLHQRYLLKILPYRMEEVVNFDPRLLVGWEAEVYNLEVDKAYHTAEMRMDFKIRQMCSAQLGGDQQRNLNISSQKHGQTFKHVILPIWLCSYTYRDKVYHFTINGQTGKVEGQKPTSYLKMGLVAFVVIACLVGLWLAKNYWM